MEGILIVIISNIFTIIIVWFKDYYIKIKLNKNKLSPIDKSELFINLTHICGEIKENLKADGVYIAYFHNGDFFKNGLSIDKFTVVAEDYNENIGKSYVSKYQNIIISYITYLYHRLLTDNRYYIEDTSKCKILDINYKNDCSERNIISSYSFLIKNSDELPIGFISVEYTTYFKFNIDLERIIWKHQTSISKQIKHIKR